jgi:hypothetical protein
MGSGVLSAPAPSAKAIEAIREAADEAVGALESQMVEVVSEMQAISPEMMAANASSYRSIQKADDLWQSELRTLIQDDARELGALASQIQSGALKAYLTQSQQDGLSVVKDTATRTAQAVPSFGEMSPIAEEHLETARRHHEMHTADVLALVKAAERAVVSAEAGPGGAVPVLEEYEKNGTRTALIAAGIAAVAIIAVVAFSR